MTSETPVNIEPPLDIIVTQAILYSPEALLAIEANGGRFVERIKASDPVWRQWEPCGGEDAADLADQLRGCEADRVLRSLVTENRIDLAICTRVHNHQTASELGLPWLWVDSECPCIRLMERSYSLFATDFGQFVLVFTFRLTGGTHAERATALRRMCRNRAVRSNLGQREYTERAYAYARAEVNRAFTEMQLCDQSVTNLSAVADPKIHGRESWIAHDLDLTAFPWFIAGRLSSEVDAILSDASDPPLPNCRYSDPTLVDASMSHGHDFGFLCDLTVGPGALRYRFAPICVLNQASYHKIRQLQRQMMRWMGVDTTRSKRPEFETHSSHFEDLAHAFYRFRLVVTLFGDSRLPRLRALNHRIATDWGMTTSIENLSQSIERHRDQLDSLRSDIALHDSRRQEAILYIIAISQVFAIISVLADYLQLNPAAAPEKSSGHFLLEHWIMTMAPWLLRIFLSVSAMLIIWRFWPPIWRRIRHWTVARYRARRIRMNNHVRDVQSGLALAHDGGDVRIGRSVLHGKGLFACRSFPRNASVLTIPEGKVIDVGHDQELVADYWNTEWNHVDGKLYVRTDPGTYYRFINHSRTPNAIVIHDASRKEFGVRSLRDIACDEEIVLDYRQEGLPESYLIRRGGYL